MPARSTPAPWRAQFAEAGRAGVRGSTTRAPSRARPAEDGCASAPGREPAAGAGVEPHEPGGSLRREIGVGALLVCATVLAMAAGGSLKAAPADAAADGRPALVLQCPLGVHRVALPGDAAER